MTTLIGTHDKFFEHVAGFGHPERPERLDAVLLGVADCNLGDRVRFFNPRPARLDELERVHEKAYVDALYRLSRNGGGRLDDDTGVSESSWDAALFAAGSGIDAVERLRAGHGDAAFLAVRPPGHHAVFDRGMGFCLLNNVAIAAASLVNLGEKVLIFDYDAHHGNGTQDIFLENPSVLYVSIHQRLLYPGTGHAEQVGLALGKGTTINIPVPAGTSIATYMMALETLVQPVVESFSPTWVIASAGFDAHRRDPLTNLGLTSYDFADLITWLFNLVPAGRRLAFLEGGYDLEALRMCTAASVAAIEGERHDTESPSSGEAVSSVLMAVREARARSLEL